MKAFKFLKKAKTKIDPVAPLNKKKFWVCRPGPGKFHSSMCCMGQRCSKLLCWLKQAETATLLCLLTQHGHRWDEGLRVQGRGGVKTKAALLTQELICSIYIRAGPRDSEGFWQWLSLWFSVFSSDIRVNDILDRLLGGGLCGWRTHLGFNKLPSPAGVLVSPPLLCKLRKHFFSHLQRKERERETEINTIWIFFFIKKKLFKEAVLWEIYSDGWLLWCRVWHTFAVSHLSAEHCYLQLLEVCKIIHGFVSCRKVLWIVSRCPQQLESIFYSCLDVQHIT